MEAFRSGRVGVPLDTPDLPGLPMSWRFSGKKPMMTSCLCWFGRCRPSIRHLWDFNCLNRVALMTLICRLSSACPGYWSNRSHLLRIVATGNLLQQANRLCPTLMCSMP